MAELKRFSWSQYDIYGDCGMRYYWRYIKQIPSLRSDFMIRGLSFEAGVQAGILEQSEDKLVKAYDDKFDLEYQQAISEGAKFEEEAIKEIRDRGLDMAKTYFKIRGKKIKVAGPESFQVKLEWVFGDIKGTGYIDIITTDLDFIDLKTADKSPQQPKWGQQVLYASIAEQVYKTQARWLRYEYTVPYKTGPPKVFIFKKKWEGLEKQAQAFAQGFIYTTEAIKRDVFIPCVESHWRCTPDQCEYHDVCPYGITRYIHADKQEVGGNEKAKESGKVISASDSGNVARKGKGRAKVIA